ncbi:DUF2345 domain-containing protein [Flavobacterium psychrophilum]|nr:DUF2345 domain-containing protein [Flavobacterium psychrophilum]
MGRVKVEFHWAGGSMKSDWMRLIQPHAGGGKGFYFVPEVGEEVLVGFEGGSAERPYVMGTQYNGSESSGYATPKNDLKVIQSRSGNRIISNDDTGDITIESQKGTTIAVIHGDGNIRFKAPKNIELEAGENIIFSAGKDITATAGGNISNSADKDITQTAGHDLSQHAAGNITESGDKKTEFVEGKITVNSAEYTEMAEKISMNTTKENMTLKASKTIIANSGEKSNFH